MPNPARHRGRPQVHGGTRDDHHHRIPAAGLSGRGAWEGDFAPAYYDFVFEDPDGIRLEIDFVPGKGLLLAPDKPLVPGIDPN